VPSERLQQHLAEFVCDNFEPKFPDADLMALFTTLGAVSRPAGAAIRRWLDGPPNDVNVAWSRGRAMLAVSADNLEVFEYDSEFKSYQKPNHMFADLLVPLEEKVKDPLIFFLAQDNGPGAVVSQLEDANAWIVSLGRPYGLGEVVGAIGYVLECQDVDANSPWFARILTEHMLDPEDPAFRRIVRRA
jgi:hypothetical protein